MSRVLVFNRRSGALFGHGGTEAIEQVRRVLGEDSEAWSADDPALDGRLRALAREDLLVVAGGDGTLQHLVNALARALGEGGDWPVLALLAVGSANDYALSLAAATGREQDLRSLGAALASGRKPYCADLGRVRAAGTSHLFANFLGLGAPGDWSRIADSRALCWIKAGLGHRIAYALCSLAVIARNRRLEVGVRSDGAEERRLPLFGLFAGKGRYLGAGMDLGDAARLDSGALTVVRVPALSRRELLKLLRSASGAALEPENVQSLAISLAGPVTANLDGEVVELGGAGRVQLAVDVLPGRLRWV